jgi:hypothetical protein
VEEVGPVGFEKASVVPELVSEAALEVELEEAGRVDGLDVKLVTSSKLVFDSAVPDGRFAVELEELGPIEMVLELAVSERELNEETELDEVEVERVNPEVIVEGFSESTVLAEIPAPDVVEVGSTGSGTSCVVTTTVELEKLEVVEVSTSGVDLVWFDQGSARLLSLNSTCFAASGRPCSPDTVSSVDKTSANLCQIQNKNHRVDSSIPWP